LHHSIVLRVTSSPGERVVRHQFFIALALLALGCGSLSQPVRAQDYSRIRIVRLSFVEGTVQYRQSGGDWQDATLNLPIQEGFALRTADGYAEVEFENSLAVRLATNSVMEFSVLALLNGGRVTQLTVPQGTAIIAAKPKREDTLSVVAANLTVKVPHNGRFRVDESSTETWVTVLNGKVEVDSGSGKASLLGSGHTLHEDANGSGAPEIAHNPPQDDFDKWVAHREEALNGSRAETSSILGMKSYTAGFADLYDYGLWSYLPGYGAGWMPYGLGAGWTPFVNGQWRFMGGTGWTWVSQEPWGWLPYHFGSWVNAPGIGWAWVPLGAMNWVPATATWVQVNNQLGWIPNGPPLSSKPTKTQQAGVPNTVILAEHPGNGVIGAGQHIPLVQAGMNVRALPAPAQPVSASARQSTQASAPVIRFSRANVSAPSRSAPPAVLAPRSMAARAAIHSASMGGFRGADARHSGAGVTRAAGVKASPAAGSPHAAAAGSVSHSGGSAGSSAGHR
jgi:hypothetical protein